MYIRRKGFNGVAVLDGNRLSRLSYTWEKIMSMIEVHQVMNDKENRMVISERGAMSSFLSWVLGRLFTQSVR